jgi:hypothetical protein
MTKMQTLRHSPDIACRDAEEGEEDDPSVVVCVVLQAAGLFVVECWFKSGIVLFNR